MDTAQGKKTKKAKNGKKNFETNSMVLFIFMMGANVCNYLFQVVAGRLLPVGEYGTLNTLMSLITCFSIPNGITSMAAARYVALQGGMGGGRAAPVAGPLLRCGAAAALCIALAGALLAAPLARALHLGSPLLVCGCAAVAAANAIAAAMYGILQGLQLFLPYGVQGLVGAGCKLAVGALLIALGYGAGGAVAAMLLGGALTVLYCGFYIRGYLAQAVRCKGESAAGFGGLARPALGMAAAQGCTTALANGDILLAKAFFDDGVAGAYSSAMVIGKIAMYVSTAVVAALFPMAVEEHGKGHGTKKLFARALLYGGGSSALMALGMGLFGGRVVGMLFGQKYLGAAQYLPAVCMFVVPLAFLTIIMNYVLAVGRAGFFVGSTLAAMAAMLALAGRFHADVAQVMALCGGALSIDVAANLFYIIRLKES